MSTERAEEFLDNTLDRVSKEAWDNSDSDYAYGQTFALLSIAQSLLVIAQELVKINERAERSRE